MERIIVVATNELFFVISFFIGFITCLIIFWLSRKFDKLFAMIDKKINSIKNEKPN